MEIKKGKLTGLPFFLSGKYFLITEYPYDRTG
ncbi:MAG: hypothetical protein BWY67_01770 [Bacteroidetes bacterium ADurb.Bin397]|jgi:hypothetical protein|nr:MAG: hypothetical protein BWY67_01770 [Bacteroidetes bacterium ADurb.Bin397]